MFTPLFAWTSIYVVPNFEGKIMSELTTGTAEHDVKTKFRSGHLFATGTISIKIGANFIDVKIAAIVYHECRRIWSNLSGPGSDF
jgi:hypothetical protein